MWQRAAIRGQREDPTLVLLFDLRRILRRMGVGMIGFSAVPESAAYRLIRGYARKVFSATPESITVLPEAIAQNEREYRLEIRRGG